MRQGRARPAGDAGQRQLQRARAEQDRGGDAAVGERRDDRPGGQRDRPAVGPATREPPGRACRRRRGRGRRRPTPAAKVSTAPVVPRSSASAAITSARPVVSSTRPWVGREMRFIAPTLFPAVADPTVRCVTRKVHPLMPRVRLDSLLAERGLFDSRSRAAAAVMAGEVLLLPGRRRAEKPGQLVGRDVEVEVASGPDFVSRGGVKLANALDALGPRRRRAPGARRRRRDRRLHRLPAPARRRPRHRPRRRLRGAALVAARG